MKKLTLATLLLCVFSTLIVNHTNAEHLKSSVYHWNDLVPSPTDVGIFRRVIDQETATLERLEIHATTLNAGLDSHPQHQHAQEEFIILQDGLLDVIINGKAQRVGPGSLFFYAANDFHSVRNVGDKPATYLVFNVATAATRTAPKEIAAKSSKPGQLPSTVYDWEQLKGTTNSRGHRHALFDSPTVTCANLEIHVTTLNTGVPSHAAHRHPDEELVIVKEGQLEITINGEASVIEAGSMAFFAANDLHGLKNVGYTEATYYVVRVVSESTALD